MLLFLITSTSVGTDCDGFADFPGCPEATHQTCQIIAPSLLHTTSVEVLMPWICQKRTAAHLTSSNRPLHFTWMVILQRFLLYGVVDGWYKPKSENWCSKTAYRLCKILNGFLLKVFGLDLSRSKDRKQVISMVKPSLPCVSGIWAEQFYIIAKSPKPYCHLPSNCNTANTANTD